MAWAVRLSGPSRQRRHTTAELLILLCSLILGVIAVSVPSHAQDYEDSDDGDELDDIHPVFGEGYFENNPEEGNSRWGPEVAACHDMVGCIIDDHGDTGGDLTAPPGTPAGSADTCDPVAPTEPVPDAAEAAAALTAALGINPEKRGLTGLETWLWVADPPGQVSWTQVGTPGRNAVCGELLAPMTEFTATVDSWTFDIDGEHASATYTSDMPGTEDDPAASHVFDDVGVYVLELTADLRGAIDARLLIDRRDYEVIEVRSRLTG